MVSFTRKRLQVFVSSTYTDLIQERQAAVEAILVAGHIPAGMELFTSGDESQTEVINQWIDESDVFMLILGGRYGSMDSKMQKSYTHLEYEYAVRQSKPLFSLVIKDSALDARVKNAGVGAIETSEPQKLKKFRAEVMSRMIRFWEDSKDIKIGVGETLSHIARRDDLVGWVRASTEADMPALADEMARLSRENALLRAKPSDNPEDSRIAGLSFDDVTKILKSKDLLGYFRSISKKLATRYGMDEDGSERPNVLAALGLVSYLEDFGGGRFTLSDAGRLFLNRLELEAVDGDEHSE